MSGGAGSKYDAYQLSQADYQLQHKNPKTQEGAEVNCIDSTACGGMPVQHPCAANVTQQGPKGPHENEDPRTCLFSLEGTARSPSLETQVCCMIYASCCVFYKHTVVCECASLSLSLYVCVYIYSHTHIYCIDCTEIGPDFWAPHSKGPASLRRRRSTTLCVAMPAWSTPGTYRATWGVVWA